MKSVSPWGRQRIHHGHSACIGVMRQASKEHRGGVKFGIVPDNAFFEQEPVFLTPLDACRDRIHRTQSRTTAKLNASRERAQRLLSRTKARVEASEACIARCRTLLKRQDKAE